MDTQTVLAVSLFFHFVATAVWIGGLLTLALTVHPALRRALTDAPALARLLTLLRKRFTPYSNLSLVVLVVTGLTQMSLDANYDGVLQISNTWSAVMLLKHLTIGAMVLSGLALQYLVAPALERVSLLVEKGKGDNASWERLRRSEVRLTWANVALGLMVLAFSAWAGSL